jgi:hypothetical protein
MQQVMKKIFEVKYVKMDIEATDDTFNIKMPFGEMNQQQMKGLDNGPIRIENVSIPVLQNLKHCHTPHWNYNDYGKNFEYKDRCGTWADFVFEE